MVNFPDIANNVSKHLNNIAKNKTLKEFVALCSASASIFFAGLTVVIIRAKPIEDDNSTAANESDTVQE